MDVLASKAPAPQESPFLAIANTQAERAGEVAGMATKNTAKTAKSTEKSVRSTEKTGKHVSGHAAKACAASSGQPCIQVYFELTANFFRYLIHCMNVLCFLALPSSSLPSSGGGGVWDVFALPRACPLNLSPLPCLNRPTVRD
jgi:hypothetical protein